MFTNKKNLVGGIAVIVIIALAIFFSQGRGNNATDETVIVPSREISVVRTYTVPNGEDTERFTVFINDEGLIADIKIREESESVSSPKLVEFSKELLKVVKGKKLADLEEVDRVGTSSLTTKAFNDALGELKSQI